MNLNLIKANMAELEIGDTKVLFSYNIPVAALIDGLYYKTDKRYSNTTQRHINQWLRDSVGVSSKPQEFFNNFMKEVK